MKYYFSTSNSINAVKSVIFRRLSQIKSQTVDYDGTEMPDGAETRTSISCGDIRYIDMIIREMFKQLEDITWRMESLEK